MIMIFSVLADRGLPFDLVLRLIIYVLPLGSHYAAAQTPRHTVAEKPLENRGGSVTPVIPDEVIAIEGVPEIYHGAIITAASYEGGKGIGLGVGAAGKQGYLVLL